MNKTSLISNFSELGRTLLLQLNDNNEVLESVMAQAFSLNAFFTPYMQKHAIETICNTFLKKDQLENWLNGYKNVSYDSEKYVGIIMAGNIPLVGFHDFLCVLASGAVAIVKMSSKDNILLPYLFKLLCKINPYWQQKCFFVNFIPDNKIIVLPQGRSIKLNALISTGSNSTAAAVKERYVDIPLLVRGRRFSFAVLSGRESPAQLEKLAMDSFLYFGLGCRNVNFFLVPRAYDFKDLIKSFSSAKTLVYNECYMNVYKRAKAMLIMDELPFIDGHFFILRNSDDVYPPLGQLHYIEYDTPMDIDAFESNNSSHIQKKYCTFGLAQAPRINEYADNIDTMEFILSA